MVTLPPISAIPDSSSGAGYDLRSAPPAGARPLPVHIEQSRRQYAIQMYELISSLE